MSVALLGAAGAVGRAVLEVLVERDVPLSFVRPLGRAAGGEVDLGGEPLKVHAVKDGAFRGCDVALLAAGAEAARTWAPKARAEGCAVVDVSPAFRSDPEVPLVVTEVNPQALAGWKLRGIVASPGAAAVGLATLLRPLASAAGLRRVHAVALESASGAGALGIQQLEREAHDLMNGVEPEPVGATVHRLAFNVVPQVGTPLDGGVTEEERGTVSELRRLLDLPALAATLVAVRVPVFYGHCLSVNVATERKLTPDAARELLRDAPGVKVVDALADGVYPMPMLSVADDSLFAGRIREDPTQENGLEIFAVLDNLHRGAAANAVRIAEVLRDAGF
jgi:aspartate-semialdehyde dehydrogenase